MSANVVEVSEPFAQLVLDLAVSRLNIPGLQLAALAGGEWGGHSMSKFEGRFSVVGSQFELAIEVPDNERHFELQEMTSLRNQKARLLLSDGSIVNSELAHLSRIDSHARLSLYHWEWRTSGVPVLWVGAVSGGRLPTLGNLVADGKSWTADVGFRLSGAYSWYLLRESNGRAASVVVDTRGEFPVRQKLIRDLTCMELAFGIGLRIDYLVGLDESRNVVGAVSAEHLARQMQRHRAPVPDYLGDASVWPPLFFDLLAKRIDNDGLEPLLLGIAPYLDALSDHIDGAYLKVQVGLEALAKRMVGQSVPEILVKDEATWKEWVKSLRSTVRTHLKEAHRDQLDGVHGKFISALYAPSGGWGKRAFGQFGICLPRELEREVQRRNFAAHGFHMNSRPEHDLDVDYRRLEMVQTMLTALVACHIGYGGPLNGYDVNERGLRPSPEWWPVSLTSSDAEKRYVCRGRLAEEVT